MKRRLTFRGELESLINRYNLEGGSDTPDYILATYIEDCVKAFERATLARTRFYSPAKIGSLTTGVSES